MTDKRMHVAYAGGFWSTNMGNSFFDLGCLHVLKKILPEAQVSFISEQPGNFWGVKPQNNEKAIDYIGSIEADYLVIAGPALGRGYITLWEESLKRLTARGCKIVFISAGCIEYNAEEAQIVRAFLKKYPHHALFTRDRYTYETFGDCFEISYDGICCAFFSNEYFEPYGLAVDPYVIYNFEKAFEPRFEKNPGANTPNRLEFDGIQWGYGPFRKKSLLQRIYYPENYEKSVGPYKILRTMHAPQPSLKGIGLYKGPDMYLSDVPYDYLNLYANARAVFSDRVHTCVAALCFGSEAMLFSDTPRAKIFEQVGASEITTRLVKLDLAYLESKKTALLENLKQVFK